MFITLCLWPSLLSSSSPALLLLKQRYKHNNLHHQHSHHFVQFTNKSECPPVSSTETPLHQPCIAPLYSALCHHYRSEVTSCKSVCDFLPSTNTWQPIWDHPEISCWLCPCSNIYSCTASLTSFILHWLLCSLWPLKSPHHIIFTALVSSTGSDDSLLHGL